MNRKDSLRGCVIAKWKASGSHVSVQYKQVLAWARECDHSLDTQGLNPAKEFRKQLEGENEQYAKAWLRGCRFPFRIVEDDLSPVSIQQTVRPSKALTSNSGWRACLKCGRLNFVDAVYCSYCGQLMPRDNK